jgi:hypothetical protein
MCCRSLGSSACVGATRTQSLELVGERGEVGDRGRTALGQLPTDLGRIDHGRDATSVGSTGNTHPPAAPDASRLHCQSCSHALMPPVMPASIAGALLGVLVRRRNSLSCHAYQAIDVAPAAQNACA